MSQQSILDNSIKISSLDHDNLLSGISALPEQLQDTWVQISKINFVSTNPISNVVVAGMGGSGLGVDIVLSALSDQLQTPVQLVQGYSLPGYIQKNSLVILASFSGTTEEIISCSKQAIERGAQIAVISAGGQLLDLAIKNNYPFYKIAAAFNRSSQQRMALGYAIMGVIGMLIKAGVCKISDTEFSQVITAVKDMTIKCGTESTTENNPAKHLAYELIDRQPLLIGAEFMQGALHTSANQLNENAKIFADYKVIPEMNHHLLEGLQFPSSNSSHLFFVFVSSELYLTANKHRLELTQEVVENHDMPSLTIKLTAPTKLAQVFEFITICSFTSIYLAIIEDIDPGPLPVVDDFKKKLK